MRGRRSAPALLLALAIVTLAVSIVGVIGSIMLNAFVFDKYDVYGEVPIPGSASLQLPAGEVNITLRTYAVGSPGGGGLPIPQIGMNIEPPPGVADPQVVESVGATTSVNNDIRRRVWVVDIPAAGTYRVTTDGKVGAFIEPRLAFGHGSRFGWLPWVFGALIAVSVLDLVIAVVWLTRRRRTAVPQFPSGLDSDFDADLDRPGVTPWPGQADQPGGAYIPSDQGIRIEQLKNLAALRDSGALSESEFQAEKRRVLDGG